MVNYKDDEKEEALEKKFCDQLDKDNKTLGYDGVTHSANHVFGLVIKFKHGQALKMNFFNREKSWLIGLFHGYIDHPNTVPAGNTNCIFLRNYSGDIVHLPLKSIQHIECRKINIVSLDYNKYWCDDYIVKC